MDIELRHMRALIAVAEELNFTRAAERLHLTQQALSGQIRQLEERVGTQLVERDTHHVALTPSGTVLYERCRTLLSGAEQAVAAARASVDAPRLTIGYPAPLTHRIAASAIELFVTRHPDVEIAIHFGELHDPRGGLSSGAADVAVVYGALGHEGLELHHLFSEPRGVALAADHPLAQQESVTIAELIAEPIVDVPTDDAISRDFWIAAKHRAGKPPRIGATVQTVDGIIEAVGAGLGVATAVPTLVEAMGGPAGVVYRPVVDLEPVEFWAARRADDDRRPVLDFIEAAVAAGRDRASPAP